MPKIDPDAAPAYEGSDYPPPHAAKFAGRIRRRLGDAVGLTTMGVNLTTLPPGVALSLRHWHEVEDEMIYLLEGEVVLVEDTGETPLRAGDAAGFPAGQANAHTVVNRSGRPALILEIGTRPGRERAHYADVDLLWTEEDGDGRYTRRDGRPLTEGEEA